MYVIMAFGWTWPRAGFTQCTQCPISNAISIGKKLCTSLKNFANKFLDRVTFVVQPRALGVRA